MNNRKMIIISMLCLAIILLVLIILIINLKGRIVDENYEYEYPEEENFVEKVTDSSEFYTIQNIINKYQYMLIFEENNEVYYILNKEYISKKNITKQNILGKLITDNDYGNKIEELDDIEIIINSMLVINNNSIKTYFVKGYMIKNNDYENKFEINLIVETDCNNMTFQISPYEYASEMGYSEIKEGYKIETKLMEIEPNEYNTYEYITVTDEMKIYDYFKTYINNVMFGNIEDSYNLLEKTYRERRFENIESYNKYIEMNLLNLIKSNLVSYMTTTTYEGKTEYICLDQYGNYYIFTENAIMDYTVILDTYTIDLPEFTEKYNNGTEQQKVALNIDKFMQSINAKDYKYAYGCLADSFKNNYFKTQEEFENYARENFYESNTVGYNEFNTQGDVYTYSVILTDKNTGEQKTKTFIMRLGEGTNFEMSFNR